MEAASRALICNALLMSLATSILPPVRDILGDRLLWFMSILATAIMLAFSVLVRMAQSHMLASLWLALLGPLYGVQQTIPFVLVASNAPVEMLGELNGYLNVALCVPQLLVSLTGGTLVAATGTDTSLFGIGIVFDLFAAIACWVLLRGKGASESGSQSSTDV